MRNRNSNEIANAWKRLNREQRKLVNDDINRTIISEARGGRSHRDGQIEYGSLQLFNLIKEEYISFGTGNGASAIVGP